MKLARRQRGVITAMIATGVALAAVGSAEADTRRTGDGNDTPGRLDMRSATHGHAGDRVVHTISTFARWRARLLAPSTPNLFAIEISTDGDRALERVVLVYSRNGRMVARVFRIAGRRLVLVGAATASKPNGRTMRVSIARSRLGNAPGYRWTAHSQYQAPGACGNVCVDKAPSPGSLRHDVTAPRITFPAPPVPASTEYDVSFAVSDSGGSGLRNWQLQQRSFGDTTWSLVEYGATGGSQSYGHLSSQDADDQFRVVARDRQGNMTTSPIRTVSVPRDDAHPFLAYAGTWSQDGAEADDFLGTLHTSTDALNATVTYSFIGSYVAIVARGLCGWGPVTIDGVAAGEIAQLCDNEKRAVVYSRTLLGGAHTLVWTLSGGTAAIDGIIVRE